MMLAVLFVTHYVADFLLQSRDMGKKKSSEPRYLFAHLFIQFMLFWPVAGFKFALMNAAIHGVIDWNIWRGYKYYAYKRIAAEAAKFNLSGDDRAKWIAESGKNWQYWEDHWFYSTIGFDQLLHALTITFLAGWLL